MKHLEDTCYGINAYIQNLSSAEKKNCSEYKKLSKEYLACVTNKIGKTIDKNLKIDGKSTSEVKEEIIKKKN